jgi:hypothetical protein
LVRDVGRAHHQDHRDRDRHHDRDRHQVRRRGHHDRDRHQDRQNCVPEHPDDPVRHHLGREHQGHLGATGHRCPPDHDQANLLANDPFAHLFHPWGAVQEDESVHRDVGSLPEAAE